MTVKVVVGWNTILYLAEKTIEVNRSYPKKRGANSDASLPRAAEHPAVSSATLIVSPVWNPSQRFMKHFSLAKEIISFCRVFSVCFLYWLDVINPVSGACKPLPECYKPPFVQQLSSSYSVL